MRGAVLLRAFQCAQVGVGQSAQTVEADGYPLGGGESADVERGGKRIRKVIGLQGAFEARGLVDQAAVEMG